MDRRSFLIWTGGISAAYFRAGSDCSKAQSALRRIAVLTGLRENDPESRMRIGAFTEELKRLGWMIGGDITIDVRYAGDTPAKINDLAQQLVTGSPDVIVTQSAPALSAVINTGTSSPVVFLQVRVDDPIIAGFAKGYSRPGGQLTGFTNFEYSMGGKWVELLREIAPKVNHALVIAYTQTIHAQQGDTDAAKVAGEKLGIEVTNVVLSEAAEIEPIIRKFARLPGTGLVLTPNNLTAVNREKIFALAYELRLPTVAAFRYMAVSGGLISYGIDVLSIFRRAAGYVDRILRGAGPDDLPIQQPDKFELVINQKTAHVLGIEIPSTLLVRADEVIE